MLVSERERVENTNRSYPTYDDRYDRYEYENRYEEDRRRTSSSYRDSLMDSLERPASRSRLERTDDERYGFYMSNIEGHVNNYDRFWDSKHENREAVATPKRRRSSRKLFVVAYLVVAFIAVIAVTLSVVGMGGKETTVKKTLGTEVAASAETVEGTGTAASETAEQMTTFGGTNYIMLSSGELTRIEVPEQTQAAKEEEKGFDKFCDWLNGVFGG